PDPHWTVQYMAGRNSETWPYPVPDTAPPPSGWVNPDGAPKPAYAFWHSAWYPYSTGSQGMPASFPWTDSPLAEDERAAWIGWTFTDLNPAAQATDILRRTEHNKQANGPGGTFHYTLSVDLTGINFSNLVVRGRRGGDDFAPDI